MKSQTEEDDDQSDDSDMVDIIDNRRIAFCHFLLTTLFTIFTTTIAIVDVQNYHCIFGRQFVGLVIDIAGLLGLFLYTIQLIPQILMNFTNNTNWVSSSLVSSSPLCVCFSLL